MSHKYLSLKTHFILFNALAGGGGPVLEHCPEAEVLEVGGEVAGQSGGNGGGEAEEPRGEG